MSDTQARGERASAKVLLWVAKHTPTHIFDRLYVRYMRRLGR